MKDSKEDFVLGPKGTGNFASSQLSDSSVTVRICTAGHRHVSGSPRNTVRDLSFSQEDAKQPTNTLSQPEENAKEWNLPASWPCNTRSQSQTPYKSTYPSTLITAQKGIVQVLGFGWKFFISPLKTVLLCKPSTRLLLHISCTPFMNIQCRRQAMRPSMFRILLGLGY